ncbi:MAG: hypothetical protein OIF38_00110 [Cellvibrionaceae bacterium]|nr:hypothetical protein [Cellvibrionaceae bacterium]
MLISSAARAQSPVDSGGLLRQEQAPPAPPVTAPQLLNKPAAKASAEQPGGQQIRLQSLLFSGATELLQQPLVATTVEQLKQRAEGQTLDFNGLQQLASQITLLLKQQGWLLARAYLPAQDISEGAVTIDIIRGQLDSIGPALVVEPVAGKPLRTDPERIKKIVSNALGEDQAVRKQGLERGLLLLNDLPGIAARARFQAGAAPRSTRIHVLTEEGGLLSGQLQGNNLGNRFTGQEQLQAQLDINSPSGRGDLLHARLTASEGVKLAQFGYALPLGHEGWQVDLAYTGLNYEVVAGQAAASADFEGESHSLEAGLRYPIMRSLGHSSWLELAARVDQFEDQLNALVISDKEIQSASLGLRGDFSDHWQGSAVNQWRLHWHHGDLDLSALPGQQASDAKSYRRAGSFNKLEYGFSRYQRFSPQWGLYLNLSGQWAGKNLDSSQKLFAGGLNGVRAYPGAEAAADSGQLLRGELHYSFSDLLKAYGDLRFKVFYDHAWVKLSQSQPRSIPILNAERANRYQLSGAGFGLSLSQRRSYSVNFSVALPVDDNPGRAEISGFDSDGQSKDYRFWLQALVWF